MKNNTTKLIATSALTLALGGAAQAATWVGPASGEEFSTAANWSDGLAPVSGSTQDINNGATVDRSVDSISGRTFVSGGSTLNITGGTHNNDISGASRYDFLGRGSAGTINQSAGTYSVGHGLSIGGGGANGNGIYALSGGTLDIYRGANSIIDASNPHGRPSLEVSDEENAGSGLFEISGGSLITRFGAGVGSTGTFSILGSSAATIGIGNNSNGNGTWLQQSGGTLSATIDLGGVTPIFIDELAGSTALAEFKAGSLLNLGFSVAPFAGTWTVLELENQDILDGGIALTGTTPAGWSLNVDNTGTNGLLTATYVPLPEPSTGLLGLLGLGFLAKRRRK